MSFTLKITKANGEHYWTDYFNTIDDLNKWLDEEKTRPYWQQDFQIEIIDTTPIVDLIEQAENALKAKSIEAIGIGASILAHIRHINVKKNMTDQQFLAMIADTDLAFIERLLWLGSFETAKLFIQAYAGSHFTQAEKDSIIALVDEAVLRVNA